MFSSGFTGFAVSTLVTVAASTYNHIPRYNNKETISTGIDQAYKCAQWYGNCLTSFGQGLYKIANTTYEYSISGFTFLTQKASQLADYYSKTDNDTTDQVVANDNQEEVSTSLSEPTVTRTRSRSMHL